MGKHILFVFLVSSLALLNGLFCSFEVQGAEKTRGVVTHAPYAEKECDSCHGSEEPGARDVIMDSHALCHNCHNEFTGKYVHSPSGLGECLLCHDAHESQYQYLLKNEIKDLCYYCHEQLEIRMTDGQNLLHAPAVEDCTACHNPHASDVSSMLLKEEVRVLCTDCHREKDIGLDFDISSVAYRHKPVEEDTGCVYCHDAHGGPFEKLLSAEPMDLCLMCHNKEIIAYDGSRLTDIEELLRTNTVHHGPIKQKNCSGCHSPHGSDYYRILLGEYPKDFYTDTFDKRNYALCFSCHEDSLLKDKQTMTSTGFKDGKTNLHYLHVNRTSKGRTCRACHEVHASNNPNHIRDSIPFGKIQWPMQIQYKVFYTDPRNGTPCSTAGSTCVKTGGSCVACHERKFYNNRTK